MHSIHALKQICCGFVAVFSVVALMAGCNQADATKPNTESKTARVKKLPKMKFHRPESFPVAVARLGEIHEVIISDSPLPEPKVFQVVEVIHGSGAGAHSHYHLASNPTDHGHGHDHADEDSNEKKHEVKVDVITEMTDIVKWMPDIAGDTDMDKDLWSSVKTGSGDLQSQLSDALSKANGQQEQRKAIQAMTNKLLTFTEAMTAIANEMDDSNSGNQDSPEE